jgi:two-component system phosphate regulon response regulator PhoB
MTRILVVEDEAAIREFIGITLRHRGLEYDEAADAEQARICLARRLPDLILIDWMLPGISGLELLRSLRKASATCDIPIILLTARDEEADKIRGLEDGADDYVTKPFSPNELLARIKAVLRRSSPRHVDEMLEVKTMSLDPVSHRIIVGDNTLEVAPTEFQLLHFFMRHQERVFSRAQLIEQVWTNNAVVEDRTVDVHILRLRKLLEPFGYDSFIQTVRGSGYRFSEKGR